MIIRKRSKPLILQKYEILQARLPANSPHYYEIQHEVDTRYRGYRGELSVDNHLKILAPKFTILEDVSLADSSGQSFQMDNLLISPNAIYLVEVKNFRRTITFDTNLNQFIRDDGKKATGYDHPITQVKMQQLKLQNWLLEHDLPNIPVHFFVAISEPSTIIQVIGNHEKISNIVLHGQHIPLKIIEYEQQLNNKRTYQHQKIGHNILRHCTDFNKDILGELGILPEQLIAGVRCYQCSYVGMGKVKWDWVCPKCGFIDRHAADRSIDEYLMLIKPWVKNRELVNYLNIKSRYVVSRLLKNHPNLQYIPERKRWEKRVNHINKRYARKKGLEN